MAIITDSTATYSVEDYDGHEQVAEEMNNGYMIVASHNRNITIRVAGLEFYADALTINTKEKIDAIHGSSLARPYALLGGDIDGSGKVSLKTWVEKGSQDSLRQALFDPLHEGRAVYFTISVDYNGDAATGGEGAHNLVTLRKCKANSDSWTFNGGSPNQSSFDFQFVEDYWFGRKP
jgi:hypothetical protein